MPIAVVTGANRGIGAEWVNQLLEKGWSVYAGYRKNLDKFIFSFHPSSSRIPTTLYAVPATNISLLSIWRAVVFNSPGTFEPKTITFFLPRFSFSVKSLPDPISKPLTLKFTGRYPLISPLT